MVENAFNINYDQGSHENKEGEVITEVKNRAVYHIACSTSHHFKLLTIFHRERGENGTFTPDEIKFFSLQICIH